MAPLSSLTVSLQLSDWPVTERTLEELALALPNVHKLGLRSCSVSSNAWARMSSLTSVTYLTINRFRGGGDVIPLAQVIAFASATLRPMALTLKGGVVSEDDQAGWEAFEEEQRKNNAQLLVTVRITQEQ